MCTYNCISTPEKNLIDRNPIIFYFCEDELMKFILIGAFPFTSGSFLRISLCPSERGDKLFSVLKFLYCSPFLRVIIWLVLKFLVLGMVVDLFGMRSRTGETELLNYATKFSPDLIGKLLL